MKQWEGLATAEGTARRCAALAGHAKRVRHGWTVGRLGWGTLPGEVKNIVDSKIERALVQILEAGLNVLDTSPAYRHRRSQAAVGRALGRELARGAVERSGIVVATHAGWLHTAKPEEDPLAELRQEVLPRTELSSNEFAGGVWSLHPLWLADQLRLAGQLCGLAAFDLLILDAPETGLKVWPRERWRAHLREAFRQCEQWVAEGRIGGYGVASLEGFRLDGRGSCALDLAELLALAREAAGGAPAFKVVQAPFSLAALDLLNLRAGGRAWLEFAQEQGLWTQALLPLGQGQLAQGLPAFLRQAMPELDCAQAALHVAGSTEGIDTLLVGMKTREHIAANCALLAHPPLHQQLWSDLFASGE